MALCPWLRVGAVSSLTLRLYDDFLLSLCLVKISDLSFVFLNPCLMLLFMLLYIACLFVYAFMTSLASFSLLLYSYFSFLLFVRPFTLSSPHPHCLLFFSSLSLFLVLRLILHVIFCLHYANALLIFLPLSLPPLLSFS